MDVATINNTVTNDSINQNLANEYSEHQLVSDFYQEIRTNYISDVNLLANYIRYRLAQGAPPNLLPDYSPTLLGENPQLIQFVSGILQNFYNQTSIEVNISFSLILTANGYTRYLWASNNFLGFTVAHTIHNLNTRQSFINRLQTFSLSDYIQRAIQTLSVKYEEVVLTPVALNIFVRRLPNIVFGKENNNGLSKCCKHVTTKNGEKNCFFLALSVYFDYKNNLLVRIDPPKKRPNKKVARKLKDHLKFLARSNRKVPLSQFFSSDGITSVGVDEFERLFEIPINIWTRNFTNLRKIKNERVEKKQKLHEYHICLRRSKLLKGNAINVLSVASDHYKTRHLLAITNPNFFSKKSFCSVCKIRFNTKWRLQRHLKTNAHKKDRILPDSPIHNLRPKSAALDELISGKKLDLERAFFYIIVDKSDKDHFKVHLEFKTNNFGSLSTSFEHQTLNQCAAFTVNIIPKLVLPLLTANLGKNALFFGELDEISQSLDAQKPDTLDDQKIKDQRLLLDSAVRFLKERTTTVPTFVTAYEKNQILIPLFIKECLKCILASNESCELSYKSKFGDFIAVSSLNKDLNLHLLSLGRSALELYADTCLSPRENCNVFDVLNLNINKAFGLDFISDRLESITQLAQHFFQTHLPLATNFSSFSPSKSLFVYLQNSVKFGHLQGEPRLIHPNANLKSFIQFDFSLFYKSILENYTLRTGLAIEFYRSDTAPVFIPKKRLTNITFANILFSTLQYVVDGHLHYELIGREYRPRHLKKSYRIDCIHSSYKDGVENVSVIEFDGCYHHSCSDEHGDIKQCHLSPINQDPNHQLDCKICQEAKTKSSKHRPQLWRLKANENAASLHPSKNVPYAQVARDSLHRIKELSDSKQFKKLTLIKECEVIEYWNTPIIEFLKKFDIPYIKNEKSLDQTLGFLYEKTLAQKLPIFCPKTKLTTQKVIDLVKSNQLFGFLVISGKAGQRSRALLGNFLPFSSMQDGKIINSFEMQEQLICTEYLSYLLSNSTEGTLPDFILTKVHKIFAYIPHTQTLFKGPCQNIDKILQNHKNDPNFRRIAKSIPNFYVGSFASNFNKSPQMVLLNEEQIYGLPQVTYSQKIEAMTANTYLLTMGRNNPFKNSLQNNIAIVQQGRMYLLKFFVELTYFCPAQAIRMNTDGIMLATPSQFPAGIKSESVFFLDFWLKPNLSRDVLRAYIDFKQKYFLAPNVCPSHDGSYLECLMENKVFIPQNCCKQYKQSGEYPLKLRIEQCGNYCIIRAKNQLCSWSYSDNSITMKCSGLKKRTLDEFLSFSKHGVHEFYQSLLQLS